MDVMRTVVHNVDYQFRMALTFYEDLYVNDVVLEAPKDEGIHVKRKSLS